MTLTDLVCYISVIISYCLNAKKQALEYFQVSMVPTGR